MADDEVLMRGRRVIRLVLLLLPAALVSCQLVWSYDGLKQQPGSGGASSSSSTSPSSAAPSSSAGGGLGGGGFGGGPSSDGGDAGCTVEKDGEACTDTCDRAALLVHESSVESDVYQCTFWNGGAANPTCVASHEDFTLACATCWAEIGACATAHCLSDCGNGEVTSVQCNDCLIRSCDCSFKACSGVVRPASVDAGVDASCAGDAG